MRQGMPSDPQRNSFLYLCHPEDEKETSLYCLLHEMGTLSTNIMSSFKDNLAVATICNLRLIGN